MNLSRTSRVEMIGVPLDLGQSHRGTDVGPAALRYAGLAERLIDDGHEVIDRGNLNVSRVQNLSNAERLGVISEVNCQLYTEVMRVYEKGDFPLILGGDHSVAIGSVAASAAQEEAGLLWVDAHGDFNTPATSPSGNIHGMPLAVIFGHGHPTLVGVGSGRRIRSDKVVLIGVRQLDKREKEALARAGVAVFSMRAIDEQGMACVVDQALQRLSGVRHLHLSLDIDVMDPTSAPGVGTPVHGGVSFRELSLLMEKVADTRLLSAMDVVEVNPMLDIRNQTAEACVSLISSALGETIV
ncbi:MAG: arginase [Polyangiaceae bacterium]|nr:arginase [Polyangiaceae bacterium]